MEISCSPWLGICWEEEARKWSQVGTACQRERLDIQAVRQQKVPDAFSVVEKRPLGRKGAGQHHRRGMHYESNLWSSLFNERHEKGKTGVEAKGEADDRRLGVRAAHFCPDSHQRAVKRNERQEENVRPTQGNRVVIAKNVGRSADKRTEGKGPRRVSPYCALTSNVYRYRLGKIKNWTGLPTTQIPFTFRTVERQEEREQKKDDPILIVVELMLSQGKTVSIPVRKDDDASVLASNFAKTYSLNLAGQKALQDILESHILGKGIEQEGSEGLQV